MNNSTTLAIAIGGVGVGLIMGSLYALQKEYKGKNTTVVTFIRSSVVFCLSGVVMLVGGYLGETCAGCQTSGFVVGMLGWAGVIYLIFVGDAAKVNASSNNEASQFAFKAMRMIVLIGWSIYPIGYWLDDASLNVVYNLADLVNKTAFGLMIWAAAKMDSK